MWVAGSLCSAALTKADNTATVAYEVDTYIHACMQQKLLRDNVTPYARTIESPHEQRR